MHFIATIYTVACTCIYLYLYSDLVPVNNLAPQSLEGAKYFKVQLL